MYEFPDSGSLMKHLCHDHEVITTKLDLARNILNKMKAISNCIQKKLNLNAKNVVTNSRGPYGVLWVFVGFWTSGLLWTVVDCCRLWWTVVDFGGLW